MHQAQPNLSTFKHLAAGAGNLIPIYRRLISDQLTPVLAYRRLVRPDDRMAPSFLLESVVGGDQMGRYSFMGAQPAARLIARGNELQYIDRLHPDRTQTTRCNDPFVEIAAVTADYRLAKIDDLPDFTGGWVGFAAYDTVRYLESEKLSESPPDDRHLPDLEMGLYRQVVAFDHVQKTILAITHVLIEEHDSINTAYEVGQLELDKLVARLETPVTDGHPELAAADVHLNSPPPPLPVSNMGLGGYQKAVLAAKDYIAAGDIFQVVPSQRFELATSADPFDIYRALRIVNPSPYMFYLQIEGAMLVGSSPEILCRVEGRTVTNRPLAGTRRRGADAREDLTLERELLADPKERAEHIMLVDLGRNDVGRVCEPGSIRLPQVMAIERYSHVMHISSTVEGQLRQGYTCWDAMRYALPVGTVSGAPKIRAMQIIDELEPTRRGPYAGAVGYVDFAGNMDMAITLRTMVIMPDASSTGEKSSPAWKVHIQAGGGTVADSDPDAEHQETLNKAAAMAKSVDLAEKAFATAR